jgi:hypothetical protein
MFPKNGTAGQPEIKKMIQQGSKNLYLVGIYGFKPFYKTFRASLAFMTFNIVKRHGAKRLYLHKQRVSADKLRPKITS